MIKSKVLALTDKINISPLPNVTADSSRIRLFLVIVFTILGALALLIVTIGGFRYVVSQGDPQATAKAKNTIIYAVIGLVIAVSAVVIVTFTLGNV